MARLLMQVVTEYLRATAGLPWIWGVVDCLIWPAGLIFEATGTDPAEGLRETYDDEAGAKAVLEAHGGILPFVSGKVDGLMTRAASPEFGFGLVRHPEFGACGAIISAGRPMLKTDGGVIIFDTLPCVAWSF